MKSINATSLSIATVLGTAAFASTDCIVPDKDIQVIVDCGSEWCLTIPNSGSGKAWGDQPPLGNDIGVQDKDGSTYFSITRCVCMTPSEDAVLEAGCPMAPCDPEFTQLKAEVTNVTYEACVEAAANNYAPALGQDTNVVTSGNNCLEASQFWGAPFQGTGDACEVPIQECDTEVAPLGDGGEPYYSLMSACPTSGTCTVPDSVFDAIDADPDLLMDSNTRLTQVSTGMQFSGILTSSLAYRLGFRNSDIVQQVNGLAFRTTANFLSVFQDLRTSETALVQIKRGGSTITKSFQREQPWP